MATATEISRPELRELTPGHRVACHWAEEIAQGKIQPHKVTPEEAASSVAAARGADLPDPVINMLS